MIFTPQHIPPPRTPPLAPCRHPNPSSTSPATPPPSRPRSYFFRNPTTPPPITSTRSPRNATGTCLHRSAEHPPSVQCYNAAVSAMAASARWREALDLVNDMTGSRGGGGGTEAGVVVPDKHTYSAASEMLCLCGSIRLLSMRVFVSCTGFRRYHPRAPSTFRMPSPTPCSGFTSALVPPEKRQKPYETAVMYGLCTRRCTIEKNRFCTVRFSLRALELHGSKNRLTGNRAEPRRRMYHRDRDNLRNSGTGSRVCPVLHHHYRVQQPLYINSWRRRPGPCSSAVVPAHNLLIMIFGLKHYPRPRPPTLNPHCQPLHYAPPTPIPTLLTPNPTLILTSPPPPCPSPLSPYRRLHVSLQPQPPPPPLPPPHRSEGLRCRWQSRRCPCAPRYYSARCRGRGGGGNGTARCVLLQRVHRCVREGGSV